MLFFFFHMCCRLLEILLGCHLIFVTSHCHFYFRRLFRFCLIRSCHWMWAVCMYLDSLLVYSLLALSVVGDSLIELDKTKQCCCKLLCDCGIRTHTIIFVHITISCPDWWLILLPHTSAFGKVKKKKHSIGFRFHSMTYKLGDYLIVHRSLSVNSWLLTTQNQNQCFIFSH